MRRRRTVRVAAIGLLAALAARAPVPPAVARGEGDARAADLAFLLDELPKRARDLLRQKGIDWAKATKDLRAAAKKVKDEAEYVRLAERIVARLRDGHAGIVKMAPEVEAAWRKASEAEARGRRWTGPRVHLLLVGKKVHVGEAFGSAAESGVKVGMEVVTVDDLPARAWVERRAEEMRDREGFSTDAAALYSACHWGLAAWEGTPIAFTFLEGKERKKLTITRDGGPNFVPSGPVHPPAGLATVGRQSYGKTPAGFAYVHLRDVPDELPRQLDQALAAVGDAPGLILDMRANGGGGCDHDEVFGRFVPPGSPWRRYPSRGAKPYAGPVVVIVDAGVRSAGETVAGMLKEDGRAFMIGPEATSGTSSQKEVVAVPSGRLEVRVSVASNMGRFNGGRGIEGIGVPPQEVVPYDPQELLRGVDTQIRRAEELLRDGFPKGAVAYQPPR